jgi:hypothetical protein
VKRLLAAVALTLIGTFGNVTLPTVHASPSACRKYNGGDWGYVYCDGGTGIYFARLRCVHWVGDTAVIYYAYGEWARAKVDASVGWCPDGYRVRRIRWFEVPS